MPAAQFPFKVENVVSFIVLGKTIVLNKLVRASEHSEYEPEQFPGLIYRVSNPRAAALIFSTGKIVCTGTKSIEDSKAAAKKVVDMIRQTGVNVPEKFNVKVENIVASAKIKAELSLPELTFSLENAEYEPEQFPGVIYRIKNPRATFLIFSTGKIICTGTKSLADVNEALWTLKARLEAVGIKVVPVV